MFRKEGGPKKKSLFIFPLQTYSSTFIHDVRYLTCSWASFDAPYRNDWVGKNI